MAKLGKFLLFSAVVGAAAAGVYHYMQNKNNSVEEFDDFDDFDDLDDFDDDKESKEDSEKRGYVALDTAKTFVSETASKAKDAATKVGKKIKSTIDDAKAKKDAEAAAETVADVASDAADVAEKSTEEFFDDDEA